MTSLSGCAPFVPQESTGTLAGDEHGGFGAGGAAARRGPAAPAGQAGPSDLPALRARGALIVDIRPNGQRSRDGELAGALVVDRNVLEWRLDPTSTDRLPEASDPDREIVLVCIEGYASSLAAAALQEMGLSAGHRPGRRVQAVLASRADPD